MKKENLFLRTTLLIINVVMVLFIVTFVYMTTRKIRLEYNARSFLNNVKAIPQDPAILLWSCLLLLLILILSFLLREKFYRKDRNLCRISLLVDVIAGYLLIYILDFNYTGLLLMISANILFHLRALGGKGNKVGLLLAVTVVGYLLTGYDLVKVYGNLYSLPDYIRYYDLQIQQVSFAFFNILNSLNTMLFVIYCIYTINQQRETIREVNHLYSELEGANSQLKEYAKMAEKMAQTKERNRLAREIHDTIGHLLTEIIVGLDACMTIFDISPDQTKHQLKVISDVARNGITDVRRSMNELRPDALERLSLKSAIEKMISDMIELSNVKVHFSCENMTLKFDEDEEMAIYRVIQESMTNAIRHGEATEIWITIEKKDGLLSLRIQDNGKGCKEIHSGFGIRHIRERIQMLKGSVEFDGSNGFLVNAKIPIRWGETYD